MHFDLSDKITNRQGGESVYIKDGKPVQHTTLTLVTEALWNIPGNDFKAAVKLGVVADRIERSWDEKAVDLSDDDLALIRQSLDRAGYPPYLVAQITKAIPELVE